MKIDIGAAQGMPGKYSERVIRVRGLKKSFEGRTVLDGIDLNARRLARWEPKGIDKRSEI